MLRRVFCRVSEELPRGGSELTAGSPAPGEGGGLTPLTTQPACLSRVRSTEQLYTIGLFTVSLRYRQGKLSQREKGKWAAVRPSVHSGP